MAVTAFQSSIGMGAVGKAIAAFFMAIGAERCNSLSHGGLRVGVVAVFAYNPLGAVYAGAPLIGGLLMTTGAQLSIRFYWHGLLWVIGLESAMAVFATDACLRIFSSRLVVAGRVAFQAGDVRAFGSPVALKDWR